MKKAEWKARALDAEARLAMPASLTFDTLTICFPQKTVTFRGRVIECDADCLTFPVTNDQYLLASARYLPLFSEKVSA